MRLFVSLFALSCLLLAGCSSEKAAPLAEGTCEFDSPSFRCTAERTTDGVVVTIRNDLGIDVPSLTFAVDQGACAQSQKVGALDDSRSATVTIRCIERPLRTPVSLDYTLPSAFAGDPPRHTGGILTVS